MSIDYSVYLGPYAACSLPRNGCLEEVDQWLEDHGETLTEAQGVSRGFHCFIDNALEGIGCHICPTYDEPDVHEIPDQAAAIEQFEQAFARELEVMRKNFVIVEVRFGLLHWVS